MKQGKEKRERGRMWTKKGKKACTNFTRLLVRLFRRDGSAETRRERKEGRKLAMEAGWQINKSAPATDLSFRDKKGFFRSSGRLDATPLLCRFPRPSSTIPPAPFSASANPRRRKNVGHGVSTRERPSLSNSISDIIYNKEASKWRWWWAMSASQRRQAKRQERDGVREKTIDSPSFRIFFRLCPLFETVENVSQAIFPANYSLGGEARREAKHGRNNGNAGVLRFSWIKGGTIDVRPVIGKQ